MPLPGFTWSPTTARDTQAYRTLYGTWPASQRYVCDGCGEMVWGRGAASHRRGCKGRPVRAVADATCTCGHHVTGHRRNGLGACQALLVDVLAVSRCDCRVFTEQT